MDIEQAVNAQVTQVFGRTGTLLILRLQRRHHPS